MELTKTKFKQTELGVIPEDWDILTFDEIADSKKKWSITGGPFGSDLKTSDYTNSGIQVIQLQNIGDGKFIDESQVFVSIVKANKLLSANIYANEIILSKMGDPVARACFMPEKAERYVMASDGIRLVVNEKKFSKKFVHDYINSDFFRIRAFEISTGSTRLRIGLPNLKSLLVICPPLPEQKAIAQVLSDTDNLIQAIEQKLTKKRAIKQGAMQQLLTPKKDWAVKKLGEVSTMSSGGTPSSKIAEYYNGNILWVSISDITKAGKFINDSAKKITEKGLLNSSAKIFSKNTVLLAMYASIGKCCIATEEVSTSQAILGIEVKKQLLNEYLYYFLLFNGEALASQGQQGTQSNLNKGMVENLDLPLPKYEEQTQIVTILSDMDAEITQLEQKLSKYKLLKQGLMQNLLTGKFRLV